MRTEVLEVPKLEFIPVPEETLEPCIVPLPPETYIELPEHLVAVYGVVRKCNQQLDTIRELMEEEDA